MRLRGVILVYVILGLLCTGGTQENKRNLPWEGTRVITKSLATVYREQEEARLNKDVAPYGTNEEREMSIDRIANSLVAWKTKLDGELWYECGERYTTLSKKQEASTKWAVALYDAQRDATYNLKSGEALTVPMESALGIITNESRFDRCAIGPWPRKWAAEHGLLLLHGRRAYSYSEDELAEVLENPKWEKEHRSADLGPGQIMWNKKKGDFRQYTTLGSGIRNVFAELVRRGVEYDTKDPAAYWPGRRSPDYLEKVMRFGRSFFRALKV
jgi:hypothetical protein